MSTNVAQNFSANPHLGWQTPAKTLNRSPLAPTKSPLGKIDFKIATVPQPIQIQNKLLQALPKETFFQLHNEMKNVELERGAVIYDIGDKFDFVYFPNDLVASRLTLMEDGAMIEVGVVGREGLLGVAALVGANSANNMTVAETDGSAMRIRTPFLREIFRRDFNLQTILLGYYNDFLTQVSQRAACRCRHSVAQQLCAWLLQIHDRTDSNDLTLTQETIANRLGARRASITVAINELERAGLLKCKRGHIMISNRVELEKLACECYGLLCGSFADQLDGGFVQ